MIRIIIAEKKPYKSPYGGKQEKPKYVVSDTRVIEIKEDTMVIIEQISQSTDKSDND